MERCRYTVHTSRLGRARQATRARVVWQALTKRPTMSYRELAALADCGVGAICQTLRLLRDLGYVTFEDGRKGARTVVVPFI